MNQSDELQSASSRSASALPPGSGGEPLTVESKPVETFGGPFVHQPHALQCSWAAKNFRERCNVGLGKFTLRPIDVIQPRSLQ